MQPPPLVEPRENAGQTLSEDSEIEGHDTSNFVFTDITYGLTPKVGIFAEASNWFLKENFDKSS